MVAEELIWVGAGAFPEKWNACTGVIEDVSLLAFQRVLCIYKSSNLKDMSIK